jgi:hypothetical protein
VKVRVAFVVRALRTEWPHIARLQESDLDREHQRFRRGIENWIVQGYLRLRRPLEALCCEVAITDRFEPGAICVAHRDDLNRYANPLHRCFVVGVRADRPPVRVAEVEVVQNPLQLDAPRARFIPHWPQPGLLPRDPARGARVERAVYFGRDKSVPAWYREAGFIDALAALGVALDVRDTDWNDYRGADLLLAHREETPSMLATKPASKLVNAWLAGVPAIVAPEPAFMALRRSDLDFIVTADARGTREAVEALARRPQLHRAMAANGLRRGAEFTVERLRERWIAFFRDEVIPEFLRWRAETRPLVRRVRFVVALSRQKIEAKRFRGRERRERREIPALEEPA